jgi:hypothetical protein
MADILFLNFAESESVLPKRMDDRQNAVLLATHFPYQTFV